MADITLKRLQTYAEGLEKISKVKRLNVVLDEELHKKLKLTAFDQGITMSEYVKRLLEESLLSPDEKQSGEEQ